MVRFGCIRSMILINEGAGENFSEHEQESKHAALVWLEFLLLELRWLQDGSNTKILSQQRHNVIDSVITLTLYIAREISFC